MRRKRRNVGLAIGLVLWATGAFGGTIWMIEYMGTAGASANAPAAWPATSPLPRDPALPTLVMVVHPKCACSRASLGELSRLMTRIRGRVRAHVVFVRPDGVADDWEKTDLFDEAMTVPDTDVVVDPGGVEARRFGALTSGQTYLYAPSGELLFSGGITPSRGHYGDNAGSSRISAIVLSRDLRPSPSTHVYGCDIEDPATANLPRR
jgi:hypothetical protein